MFRGLDLSAPACPASSLHGALLLPQRLAIWSLRPACLEIGVHPARASPCPADAHQLQAWYSLPLELARAIQAVGVNAVVADHLLPQVRLY